MRALITMLIVMMMAAHASLGCCWHHAHAFEAHPRIGEGSAAGHGDCPGHHCDSHETLPEQVAAAPSRSEAPCPCKHSAPCEESDCVFLRTNSGSHSQRLVSAGLVVPLTLELPRAGLGAGFQSPSLHSHRPLSTVSLRAHLVLQVLLI